MDIEKLGKYSILMLDVAIFALVVETQHASDLTGPAAFDSEAESCVIMTR